MTDSVEKSERRRPHPPFAQPGPGRRATPESSVAAMEAAELPSIEEFVDELPLIDEFLAETAAGQGEGDLRQSPATHDWSEASLYRAPDRPAPPTASPPSGRSAVSTGTLDTDEEGWAVADWQSYNWSGLASLGAPGPEAVEAHAAWSSTDWDPAARGLGGVAGRQGGLPPGEVAAALDEIARRIRSGELSLEQFQGTPPEAAIAAVFAALLRTRT